jgi:hypothetical protein
LFFLKQNWGLKIFYGPPGKIYQSQESPLKKMDSIQEKALKMALSGHNLLITGYPEVA